MPLKGMRCKIFLRKSDSYGAKWTGAWLVYAVFTRSGQIWECLRLVMTWLREIN